MISKKEQSKKAFKSIISSDIFTFVVGPDGKEYNVHGTAISRLSKPLDVLINGEMREAKEKCVKWPDIDEQTFVRFTQWAYTKTYVTEEPDILLDDSLIGAPIFAQIVSEGKGTEVPLYSLATENFSHSQMKACCWNRSCESYRKRNPWSDHRATCLACRRVYTTTACASCNSVYTDCPHCGPLTSTTRNSCAYNSCNYRVSMGNATTGSVTCLRCRAEYSTKLCRCQSAFSDCGDCAAANEQPEPLKRRELIHKFLDENGIMFPTSTSVFPARKNIEGCEDYTGVFLCHAKLYVVADTYDVPALKQLSLHRLHATLKEFTLYPSRLDDIATLAKYVFENTVPEDKIRDMITLYYACIIEDARKSEGLKSLIHDVPDFAYGLINKLSDRLA